jgi:hypothetical protein
VIESINFIISILQYRIFYEIILQGLGYSNAFLVIFMQNVISFIRVRHFLLFMSRGFELFYLVIIHDYYLLFIQRSIHLV